MPPNGQSTPHQVPLDLHPSADQRFLAAIREIVSPLATRFEGQDKALDRVASRVDAIAQDVAHLRMELRYRRRNLRGATKRRHLIDIRAMGGRCPCCASAEVLDAAGQRSPFAEYDHFYASSHPDPEHTWLICKACHTGLTTGRVPRDQREAEFRAYQSKRRRLGRDGRLL
jgi:hypothetical protein